MLGLCMQIIKRSDFVCKGIPKIIYLKNEFYYVHNTKDTLFLQI